MTTLRLYNTLSRTKEDFVPLDPANVRMYVCGPTVYDYAHIGNARPAIVFDVLFRLLRHLYGPAAVTYVRNITDIDDKINARAMERRGDRNLPILDVLRELTEQTYGVYREDVMALGCLEPTYMPRATQYVAQMIAMTGTLIDLGYAYAAEGHVLFRVKKKSDYGKLARRSLDDMLAGARVDVAPYKEDPMDFVLWKPSDDQTPGWDSPWGRGRPGWHLECSAMIEATMGETIDIHGGGIDLVFPHHENEIAQSEGAHHGHALARYWMHNGFLNVEGEKMSKSLGNFVTIDELRNSKKFGGRRWAGENLRFAMLQTHYRQPIDWSTSILRQSELRLKRWKEFAVERVSGQTNEKELHKLRSGILNDLNAPQAFAWVDELLNRSDGNDLDRGTVYEFLRLLGFKPRNAARERANQITKVVHLSKWLFNPTPSCLDDFECLVPHLRSSLSTNFGILHEILKAKKREFLLWSEEPQISSLMHQIKGDLISDNFEHPSPVRVSWEKLDKEWKSLVGALARLSDNEWRKHASLGSRPRSKLGENRSSALLIAWASVLLDFSSALSISFSHFVDNTLLENFSREMGANKRNSEFGKREAWIEDRIKMRARARENRDFAESDRIRDELLMQGIVLKDSPTGTTWEVKR